MSDIGDLLITVMQVKGNCPIYKAGDSFKILHGFKLIAKKPICMHSLASLMPYYIALSRGLLPEELGLSRGDDAAYLQCLDPCDYTSGGTVVFRITRGVHGR